MREKITAFLILCAGLISCTENPDEVKSYSILFTENPVMVGANGGTTSCVFVSEHQWNAEAVDSWISEVSVNGDEVTFSVAANPEESIRDGKIRFTVSGDDYSKDLTIRQSANTGRLTVEKTSVEIETLGTEMEVKVTAGENWNVTAVSDSWLNAQRKNSTTLLLSAAPNYSGTKLSAQVTIKTASEKESAIISVTQAADNSAFGGATTPEGRMFVHKSSGLVSTVTNEKVYQIGESVNALEMQFLHKSGSSTDAYSFFIFEVDVTKDVTILASCTDDDPNNIKPTDTELTAVSTIRDQFYAMQTNRESTIELLCGVNGDFCYGLNTSTSRNNMLHGVMHKDGKCVKGTFDGGNVCTVFAMMKDGTARIFNQSEYASQKDNIAEAVGGRQTIISAGGVENFTDTRFEPRTAVGVSRDGDKVYLLVVDGRRSGYSVGASYEVLAQIFKAYGVFNAINLDGGGSSTFLIKNAGASKGFETRNRPTDTTGDRAVPNGIAVVRKK